MSPGAEANAVVAVSRIVIKKMETFVYVLR
jgi:hypothetical protein